MSGRENDPDSLGRKAQETRQSQEEMYGSLEDLKDQILDEADDEEEAENLINNLETRIGMLLEDTETTYDTVREFSEDLKERYGRQKKGLLARGFGLLPGDSPKEKTGYGMAGLGTLFIAGDILGIAPNDCGYDLDLYENVDWFLSSDCPPTETPTEPGYTVPEAYQGHIPEGCKVDDSTLSDIESILEHEGGDAERAGEYLDDGSLELYKDGGELGITGSIDGQSFDYSSSEEICA